MVKPWKTRVHERVGDPPLYRSMKCALLDLGSSTIDEQFDPGHKTGIVGGKKERRRCDLMRLTDPAHWNQGDELILDLLWNSDECAGVDSAGTEHIHTNLSGFQIHRPGARER